MGRFRTAFMAAAVALATGLHASAQADDTTMMAAASLTDALEELGARYAAETGKTVVFAFASSSALAKQIAAGSPAQIFASADEKWMDYLSERQLIEEDTRISPIGNSLVLIVPVDSPVAEVTIDSSLDLAALLGDGGRLSVGDPDHVPAGVYAKESLEWLGLWGTAEPLLARADDVRAALVLVERGEAPAGIVYATDAAVSDRVRVVGTFPADSHKSITYPFAVVAGENSADVVAFFDYVTGPTALATFEKYGFTANE